MSELFFIVKSIFLTLVVIILFQVKIGETTLEEKTIYWAQQSSVLQPLHEVAHGGVKVLRESWKVFFGNLNSKFFSSLNTSNMPGKRDLNLSLKRSEAFLRDQAERVKNQSESMARSAKESWKKTRQQSATSESPHLEEEEAPTSIY